MFSRIERKSSLQEGMPKAGGKTDGYSRMSFSGTSAGNHSSSHPPWRAPSLSREGFRIWRPKAAWKVHPPLKGGMSRSDRGEDWCLKHKELFLNKVKWNHSSLYAANFSPGSLKIPVWNLLRFSILEIVLVCRFCRKYLWNRHRSSRSTFLLSRNDYRKIGKYKL